jgi:hypothetical protein
MKSHLRLPAWCVCISSSLSGQSEVTNRAVAFSLRRLAAVHRPSEVEHPELGRSFIYPGEAAIYNSSPWRISRRAPLIGEHNTEILCDALGLSRAELSVLAENRVI